MLKQLRFRKNVLGQEGFKKFIREDFDANPNSFAIANKSHVTFNTQHSIKQTIVENLVVRVKRGPEATLENFLCPG